MMLKMKWNEDSVEKDVKETESSLYKEVGKLLIDISIPNRLEIRCEKGSAVYQITQRGTYKKWEKDKNGNTIAVTYPSMYVREEYNNINLPSSSYKPLYLTCVNDASNNYKFYKLSVSETDSTKLDAAWGRIGAEKGDFYGNKESPCLYDTRFYWIRYYEKLSKGYKKQVISKKKEDICEKVAEIKATTIKGKPLKVNDDSRKLFDFLKSQSRQYITQNCVSSNIEEWQYMKSRKLLKDLTERKTVKGFNTKLKELLAVCPRRTDDVSKLLARSNTEFQYILDREERLVNAMSSLISSSLVVADCFELHNIEVYVATDKQTEEVKKLLSPNLKNKVKSVYRVINKDKQIAFDKYLKKHNIKKVKQFWHGSKTENWLSIILNGLKVNPVNVAITGKMFGNGIYFAPLSDKAYKYTSCQGSYWAKGNQSTGFMGVYATAYGTPYDTYCACKYTKSFLDSHSANCVHAHAGSQLMNDEIVFFDNDAVVMNYIVEMYA